MGTTRRSGIPQSIARNQAQNSRIERAKAKRYQPEKRPGMARRLMAMVLPSLFAHRPVIIGGQPQKPCACGCGRKSFNSTYFQLKCAMLHKQAIA